jgi:1,2-diacylglycerol 3-alpha-glucosyltransferase
VRIGFVSAWFDRGAAYVTRAYIDLLESYHQVFVYARAGEHYAKGDPEWDRPYVTWAPRMDQTYVAWRHLKRWILANELDCVFFNEQQNVDVLFRLRREMPRLKLGSYIDYCKQDTVAYFECFDFLISNTKRHHEVFGHQPQSFFIPWGTDVEVFKPVTRDWSEIRFFHSSGMASRKGTDLLIRTFVNSDLGRVSKLIVHSQLDLEKTLGICPDELAGNNVEVITRTVGPPGLYHLGDVYVYPTYLEGLGLTIFEALACGLPVVCTDYGPMNEVIGEGNGRLVEVARVTSRADAYYWPMAFCDAGSLERAMRWYVEHADQLPRLRARARDYAVSQLNWRDRQQAVREAFEKSRVLGHDRARLKLLEAQYRKAALRQLKSALNAVAPDWARVILFRAGEIYRKYKSRS